MSIVPRLRPLALTAAGLAFSSTRDGNAELYRMNVDGTGLTRLTSHSGVDTTPAW